MALIWNVNAALDRDHHDLDAVVLIDVYAHATRDVGLDGVADAVAYLARHRARVVQPGNGAIVVNADIYFAAPSVGKLDGGSFYAIRVFGDKARNSRSRRTTWGNPRNLDFRHWGMFSAFKVAFN
jgi:hypothetical protein